MKLLKPYVGYGVAEDLILSVMTERNASMVERIQTAGIAGFQGIGWRIEDFTNDQKDGINEAHIVNLLTISKVQALEVEFFRSWIGHENDSDYQDRERHILRLAGSLGARHINVAVFERYPQEAITKNLRDLCRRAAPYNLIVQLEFMPYTPPVNTLQAAWDIVRHVDEPNCGLLVDSWHWGRTDGNTEALKFIPPERITSIQLSDILAEPLSDIHYESLHYRQIPGAGAFNLVDFLQIMENHGVTAPLSVEVMSDALDALPVEQAAKDVAFGTRSILWQTMLQPTEKNC